MKRNDIREYLLDFFKHVVISSCIIYVCLCVLYVHKMLDYYDSAILQAFIILLLVIVVLILATIFYFYCYHMPSWNLALIIPQVVWWAFLSMAIIDLYFGRLVFVFADSVRGYAYIYCATFVVLLIIIFAIYNYRYDGYKLYRNKLFFTISLVLFCVAVIILAFIFKFKNETISAFIVSIFCFGISVYAAALSKPFQMLNTPAQSSSVRMRYYRYSGLSVVLPIFLFLDKRVNVAYYLAMLMYFVFYQVFVVTMSSVYSTNNEMDLQVKEQLYLSDCFNEKIKEIDIANRALIAKAQTDVLTGLCNRNVFYESLGRLMEQNSPFCLFYIDLNRFKFVNDLHGHSIGDLLLQAVTARLSSLITKGAELFRIGGDEFAITLNSVSDTSIVSLCKDISEVFDEPFKIKNYEFNLSSSIGVARYPSDATTQDELLKYADIAMYHAKKFNKKSGFYIFSPVLHAVTDRKNHLQNLLKTVDVKNDFTVYYQPLWRAETKEIVGCEALIRWFHPTEGFISPAEFIPVAEETGLINELTYFVADTALKQVVKWESLLSSNFKVGINLSPVVLNELGFKQDIMNVIKSTKIDSSYVDFEITENVAMNSSPVMDELFLSFFKADISVSIDDFGTGYSSLNYIKKFDIDTIKIAKELVDNIVANDDEQILVKAIIMMAKGLNLDTIAEGVETEEQLEILKSFGCDRIQGYLLGKPVNANEFEKSFLRSRIEGK